MTANYRQTLLLWGCVLIFSSKTAGQSCLSKCGDVLEHCSCHATCVSLRNCCADYNQSCFQVSPYSSSMLGGRALRIHSLLLHPNERVLCRFKGEIERNGFCDAEGQAYCITPLLYETGWIQFSVSIDGINFDRSGEYLSVHPSDANPSFQVTLVNTTQWQNYGTHHTAERLQMTWNRSLMGAQMVNVELWGYQEPSRGAGANGSAASEARMSYLYSLGKNVPNTGSFSFVPEPSKEHWDWQVGNIRITASAVSDGSRDVEALWSGAHVLAWHLDQAFRDHPATWAKDKCLQWDDWEEELPNFVDELIDCPCTLAQARADTGRFVTDSSCDVEQVSVCPHRPGGVHCVTATQPSPTHGSGQQCCYDGSGALVLTGDSVGGGIPHRAHHRGSPPYGGPPRVPGYSHWLYDVMSFYYCCVWSDHCHIYLNRRPSSGCHDYRPPRAAAVFGDPHFITFDGFSYTFNGEGEYYLVSSPHRELSVQARTQELTLRSANATQLSSVAMKEKGSDVIEVRQTEGHLQVLGNQRVLPFTEHRRMDLHGVLVCSPSPQDVSITFSSGAAVEVHVHEGIMAVTVLLPTEFTNQTQGLLGLMNSDPSDDLLTHLGHVIPSADATAEHVFAFGAGWNTSKTSSLFTYDSQSLLDHYYLPPSHHPAFVPTFSLPQSPDDPLVADMLTVCFGEGAWFCKYDTLTTRSLAAGKSTLRVFQNHQALIQGLEPVVSCDRLPAPRNGKKNGSNYLQGSTLSFSCNEGFLLYGSSERTCVDDGAWSGEQPHCVTDTKVGLVLGAVGALSALVTVGIMINLHNRKQDRERTEKLDQVEVQEQTC